MNRLWLSLLAVASTALLLACASNNGAAQPPEGGRDDCWELSLDDCEGQIGCGVALAWPMERASDGRWCFPRATYPAPAGCFPTNDGSSLGVIVYLSPADDPSRCYAFGASPGAGDAWVPCDAEIASARDCP